MENKTISYLNSKAWYRFLKVIFVVMFLIVLMGFNSIIFSDGIKKLDLTKSTIICNADETLGTEKHQITFEDVDKYFIVKEFDNYNYYNFIKTWKDDALAIVNKCNEGSKWHPRLIDFGPNINPPEFEINPVYSYITFVEYFIVGNLIVLFIFEAIRKAFYYVVLGSLKPAKKEMKEKTEDNNN